MREHTEALAPPRALWVPFMLGRPFGAPGDAAFQRKVLIAALGLLERDAGPVLEDFPENAALDARPAPAGLVCPVAFPVLPKAGSLVQDLIDEVTQLNAWHDVAVKYRGRSTLGVTGLAIMDIVSHLEAWLSGGPPSWVVPGLSQGETLKHACDELRAFYLEAKAMQPGLHSSDSLQRWFWLETVAGEALLKIREIAANSANASAKAVAVQSIVPRVVEGWLNQRSAQAHAATPGKENPLLQGE
ncbi:MAG: hypothetical protein FJY56_03995 [Betaproteobacteria bacterium]|nr:hypothetical protein [Betaproteobacteria bacterium]